jgi:hypothetical protein
MAVFLTIQRIFGFHNIKEYLHKLNISHLQNMFVSFSTVINIALQNTTIDRTQSVTMTLTKILLNNLKTSNIYRILLNTDISYKLLRDCAVTYVQENVMGLIMIRF